MDVSLLGTVKIITAGVSRIYRSLALSSNGLAESYAKALEYNGVAIRRNVRIGSKADIGARSVHVRFTPKSGIRCGGANKKTSKLKTLTHQWAVRAKCSGYGLHGTARPVPLARCSSSTGAANPACQPARAQRAKNARRPAVAGALFSGQGTKPARHPQGHCSDSLMAWPLLGHPQNTLFGLRAE
jgi:hypothetical protein